MLLQLWTSKQAVFSVGKLKLSARQLRLPIHTQLFNSHYDAAESIPVVTGPGRPIVYLQLATVRSSRRWTRPAAVSQLGRLCARDNCTLRTCTATPRPDHKHPTTVFEHLTALFNISHTCKTVKTGQISAKLHRGVLNRCCSCRFVCEKFH